MAYKLNFEKLRRSLQSRGPPVYTNYQRREYGSNYRSPYLTSRADGMRNSAPSVLVHSDRRRTFMSDADRAHSLSPISIYEMNEGRKRRRSQPGEQANPRKTSVDSMQIESGRQRLQKVKGISGYFFSEPDKKTKEASALETSSSAGGGGTRPGRNTVTFSNSVSTPDENQIPHNSLTIRDGSLILNLDDIADLPQVQLNVEKEEPYAEGGNYSLQEEMDESLDKIRNSNCQEKEETLKEYYAHRKHFWQTFLVYAIISIIGCVLPLVFVFHYNYGFQRSGDKAILGKNETVQIHEWGRTYLNAHMLIMTIPTTYVMAASTLIYRIFTNVSRMHLRWYHGIINLLGSCCSALGVFFAYKYHTVVESTHFSSLHTYIGLFALVNQGIAVAGGLVFVLPCCSWNVRISMLPIHRTIGSILLMVDAAAVVTGCVTFSVKYFDCEQFPQFYAIPYRKIHLRSVNLNLVGIFCLMNVGAMLYIQSNYMFRHRRTPNLVVNDRRHGRSEGSEDGDIMRTSRVKNTLAEKDEIQLGSRKSFGPKKRQSPSHEQTPDIKSIPLLIRGEEQKKANFNDMDFLIALE